MNKLHNFCFVGEFPMFQSPEDNGLLINGSRKNLHILSQEIYLPPFDNSKAYDDSLTDNDTDGASYDLRFLEGYDFPGTFLAAESSEFIFFENLDQELQNALPDISLQEIFSDPFVMTVGDNTQDQNISTDFAFSDNDVMNLYYWNENIGRDRRMKGFKEGRENRHKKRRTL